MLEIPPAPEDFLHVKTKVIVFETPPSPPEFLHVTLRHDGDIMPGAQYYDVPVEKSGPPTASVIAHEPETKGYDKRLKKQMDWAYDRFGTGYTVKEDGVYINEHKGWTLEEGSDGTVPMMRVKDRLQPRIIKNEPLEGFKVGFIGFYHDMGTSRANKRWWIHHPLGFEFPISAYDMLVLLHNSVIDNGVINGKLQFSAFDDWRFVK